jgi:hypothetical protein
MLKFNCLIIQNDSIFNFMHDYPVDNNNIDIWKQKLRNIE